MAILDVLKRNKDEKPKEEKVSENPASSPSSVLAKPAAAKSYGEAKKETKKKDSKTVIKNVGNARETTTLQNILKHPRITEKAAILAERGAYTFEVDSHATKIEIARAVKQIYNVEPVRVNIVKLPAKKVFIRGRRGTKKAVKKAIVYLKEGDKIEFV
jgi:large subunit ribosomal protein L23